MKEGFTIDINGINFRFSHTKRFPGGPTIIFLHESFGCIRHWRTFPDALGEITGCNTLVYDRQGYGQSDPFTITKRTNDYLVKEADVLNSIIGHFQFREVILFGHSDGGTIALLMAAKYPEKIKAVITEGAHVFVEEVTLNGIRHAVKLYHSADLKNKIEYYHGDKVEMVFRLWSETWLSEEFRSWNIEPCLKMIVCPVLVIQGAFDEYGSIEQVNSIEKNISGRSERCIPPAGHTPHRESPEVVARAVKAFLIPHDEVSCF